jgi:hypothetical protein
MTDKNNQTPLPTALPTTALESKLKTLREQSQKHSQALTQKLATSQSGQNLLHIGTSLSTLPPDLHSLLTHLHPLLSDIEDYETSSVELLQDLVHRANEVRILQRRMEHARECAQLYEDLQASEQTIQRNEQYGTLIQDEDLERDGILDQVDHVHSLERAAHTTLCLVQDLTHSTAQVSATTTLDSNATTTTLPSLRTPLDHDSERAQFLMKLAPRIRRLESGTIKALSTRLESVLQQLQQEEGQEHDHVDQTTELTMIGHCMRGLALLGKGKEAENVFARVAIMPLIRSKVSMGRLDEGGSRGECTGLFSLLDDIACSISQNFGQVLRLSESIPEIDLVTEGVWVPIATALMADAAIKMAIFSPGIASILQANYTALNTFLSELAERLLQENVDKQSSHIAAETDALESFYYRPSITTETIQQAQDRIYAHSMTADFSKRWNLPIYYQLRFGESCSRLNNAISRTQIEGWLADVFTDSETDEDLLKSASGLEQQLFLELYDILLGLWRPEVILRPLTHRFLRGSVQLVGRVVSFVSDGLEGKIKFGQEKQLIDAASENGDGTNGDASYFVRDPYCWGDDVKEVATIAWELTVLESRMTHDYVEIVMQAVDSPENSESDRTELRSIVKEVLLEASQQINPVVQKSWNEIIVSNLSEKCSGPLAAVKGVAATYRMTNRPPPTNASPFVATILRPLKEFDDEFKHKIPPQVGMRWKQTIVTTVANRYSSAVQELIATVQRTEEALKNRKARRMSAGGMSDGEKVKLQLYLDYMEFSRNVKEVGVNVASVEGVSKLKDLTIAAESLHQRNRANGSS